jgi:hypothetical protein
MDDCFRLVLASGQLCAPFQEAMRAHWEFARLGSGTRAGDRHSVRLLSTFRARWASRRTQDLLEPKLAFVLGWLCHRAADRQMKPVFRQADPGYPGTPTDCSVYHDAFLFGEVYANDPTGPYPAATFETDLASLPAAAALDVDAVRELFHTLMQQALIEIHTFKPDESRIEDWLAGLFDLQQGFYVNVERYAAAIADPDADKVRRFITEVHFDDREEPIIRAARALRPQLGRDVTAAEVRAALQAEAHSHYAQAVKMGCQYLLAASAFFTGEIEADDLRARLDIGKLGWDGKSV